MGIVTMTVTMKRPITFIASHCSHLLAFQSSAVKFAVLFMATTHPLFASSNVMS
jgi:hypothetical protein